MTLLEARIRRRLFGTKRVTVSTILPGEVVFEDDSVVKLRRVRDGIRLWTFWWGKHQEDEVVEWWFPCPDEVRIER
jgi:hypothetical protein